MLWRKNSNAAVRWSPWVAGSMTLLPARNPQPRVKCQLLEQYLFLYLCSPNNWVVCHQGNPGPSTFFITPLGVYVSEWQLKSRFACFDSEPGRLRRKAETQRELALPFQYLWRELWFMPLNWLTPVYSPCRYRYLFSNHDNSQVRGGGGITQHLWVCGHIKIISNRAVWCPLPPTSAGRHKLTAS